MARILLDRIHGGFGDLMMISPGIAALQSQGHEVGLVVDQRFHELFTHWSDLQLLTRISGQWDDIINLHDPCPATFVEMRHVHVNRMPTGSTWVNKDRILIFAQTMGVDLSLDQRKPAVRLGESNRRIAINAVPWDAFIYVQPTCADVYRDWPHFEELVIALEKAGHRVVVSGDVPMGESLKLNLSLLDALAVMERATMVISPDSMAVHAAAALDRPCVALYGPIAAETRISTYPLCSAVRADVSCYPCWRNRDVECQLTNDLKLSKCMSGLSVESVLDECLSRLHLINSGNLKPTCKIRVASSM